MSLSLSFGCLNVPVSSILISKSNETSQGAQVYDLCFAMISMLGTAKKRLAALQFKYFIVHWCIKKDKFSNHEKPIKETDQVV